MARSVPVVIVNPRAGGGLGERRWAKVAAAITDGLGPFDVRFTERPGDGRRIALEEATAKRDLVVALGGDGTISEVADGLLATRDGTRPPTQMGIIPHGTGGDFRRALDLPDDVTRAARRVRESRPRPVDVGQATFVAHDGTTATRAFVNVASFGFSSAVALRANSSSKRLGAKAAFLGATMRTLLSYENVEVLLAIDGREARRATLLLGAIGNGQYFGGGMKICPDAAIDDAAFDLVTVGDFKRAEVLAKIHRLYAGTHLALSRVESARAGAIDVRAVDPDLDVPIELDGETPGRLPARFAIEPGALLLRA